MEPELKPGPIGDDQPIASTSAPQPSPPPQPAPDSAPAPADISQPSAPAAPATQPAAAPFSVREYLVQRGYRPEQFPDEQAAFFYVMNEAQSAIQQANQHREQVAAYQQQLQMLQQQQQAAAAPAAPGKKKWYTAPEYDPAWATMIQLDENGKPVPAPGAPADVVMKWQAFKRHQQAFSEKFAQDPLGSLKEGIREEIYPEIMEQVRKEFAGTLGSLQERSYANHVAQTADWAYQKDANGRRAVDMQGNPIFTPEGATYMNAADMLHKGGVQDLRLQDQLARLITAGLIATRAANSAIPQAVAKPESALAGALRTPSHGGSTIPPSNTIVPSGPQNGELSLSEVLRQEMARAGVKDSDFQ